MGIHNERIPEDRYTEFLNCMPQISVELFLVDDGKVLLAKRVNKPLRGKWFWPGGRLYKGERLGEAVHRIAREELGIEVKIEEKLGVYSHFWNESPFENVKSVHTVNIVYRVQPVEDVKNINLDDQHEDYKFISGIEPGLHKYVKRYIKDSGIFD